jgi:hypothetical protein
MTMSINEPGNKGPPFTVDEPGLFGSARRKEFSPPDSLDPAAPDSHHLRPGLLGFQSQYPGII